MSIFVNINELNFAIEEDFQNLLTTISNYPLTSKGLYSYSYKNIDSNVISYYLPINTIILCDKSKVAPITNNLGEINIGYRVLVTGLVEISLKSNSPITLI